jgi:hypothetical protein
MEARARRITVEVEAIEEDVRRLRREIVALQEDPWFIERVLRRHARDGILPVAAPVTGSPAPSR